MKSIRKVKVIVIISFLFLFSAHLSKMAGQTCVTGTSLSGYSSVGSFNPPLIQTIKACNSGKITQMKFTVSGLTNPAFTSGTLEIRAGDCTTSTPLYSQTLTSSNVSLSGGYYTINTNGVTPFNISQGSTYKITITANVFGLLAAPALLNTDYLDGNACDQSAGLDYYLSWTTISILRPFPVGLPTCLEDDFRELEKLYDATNGNNWTNKTNWFTNPNMATWYGVTLTPSGCDVNTILLSNNNLQGTLTNMNLPALTGLFLSQNKLSGSIPNFSLINLIYLNIDNNQFSGTIPNFTGLPKITQLVLSSNQLTGSLPDFSNCPKIDRILAAYNQLTGVIPNYNLPFLSTLYLNNNQLSGSIPLLNQTAIAALNLSYNQLTGSIPNFNAPNMLYLYLNANQFTGGVPAFNFPLLTNIDISDNPNLGGNVPSLTSSTNLQTYYAVRSGLTGSIPNFSQSNLKTLWLWDNQLIGSIPNFNLPSLLDLQLQTNQLSGSIPNFSTPSLTYLRLENNQLTGSIPDFNLPNLKILYIGTNLLTGSIPNFTGIPALVEFFASLNQLSGNIPNFSNMPNLKVISLSVNQLTGSIPNFNLPSLSTLFLRDNQLSGNVPNFSNISLNAAPPTFTRIWLYGNKFIFGDIEGKTWLNTTDVRYEPQAKIPIAFNGTNLSVNTGSANNVQQFTWYKDDVIVTTNQNNTFTPTVSGKYYCKVSHNTITTTSDTLRNLILQSEDYIHTAVPVELLNFTATPLSKTTQLNWQTASEKNASHFDVERSHNGKTFDKIGQVKASGNSATLKTYDFVDEKPNNGINYYRLRQIDFDGAETLSNIVSVTFNVNQKLQVFPNPAKDKLTIISETANDYVIFNTMGQEIRSGTLSNNRTDVDIAALPSGTYLVKTKGETVKFFKN